MFPRELRAAFDVGEEKGDRATRVGGHHCLPLILSIMT